eukprot:scaffold2198_cov103-Skeletonema_dohrnii-CCMP3373.AAC.3
MEVTTYQSSLEGLNCAYESHVCGDKMLLLAQNKTGTMSIIGLFKLNDAVRLLDNSRKGSSNDLTLWHAARNVIIQVSPCRCSLRLKGKVENAAVPILAL